MIRSIIKAKTFEKQVKRKRHRTERVAAPNLTERGCHWLKAAFKGKSCEVRPGVDLVNDTESISSSRIRAAYVTCD